jgi:hypothetical protein
MLKRVKNPTPLLSKEGMSAPKAQTGAVCSKSRAAAPFRYPRVARSLLPFTQHVESQHQKIQLPVHLTTRFGIDRGIDQLPKIVDLLL